MLSISACAFGVALERAGRDGIARIEAALTPRAQRELGSALAEAAFESARERVDDVIQDFDVLVERPGARLPVIGELEEEYGRFVREQACSLHMPWLADYVPTDCHVQRYRPGSRGISPHRDGRRFVKLISIFSLGDPAEFVHCRDRAGTPLGSFVLASGDLLLLRATGFAEHDRAGPLHKVLGPTPGIRYSIAFRMRRARGRHR